MGVMSTGSLTSALSSGFDSTTAAQSNAGDRKSVV